MPKGSKNTGRSKPQSGSSVKKAEPSKGSGKNNASSAKTKQSENTSQKSSLPREKKPIDENSMLYNLFPYLLGFAAVISAFFIAFPEHAGFFGSIAFFFRGLLSYAVWAIPIFMFFGALRLKSDMLKGRVMQKFVFSIICTVFISVLTQLIFISMQDGAAENPFNDIAGCYEAAKSFKNGGVAGGIIGVALYKATGDAAIFIASFIVLIFALFEFGCTPEDIFVYIKDRVREKYHDISSRQRETRELPAQEPGSSFTDSSQKNHTRPTLAPEKRVHTAYKVNRDLAYSLTKKNINVDIGEKKQQKHSVFDNLDLSGEKDELIKQKIAAENIAAAEKSISATADENISGDIVPDSAPFDLSGKTTGNISAVQNSKAIGEIFADGAVIEAGGMAMNTSLLDKEVIDTSEGSEVISEVSDKEEIGFEVESGKLTVEARPTIEELYSYPSTDLLKADPNPMTFTVTEELKATAVKLVDTLANFGVRTKITNISCGPTVTRYELQPDVGVRVKSIQNLSDDIALHLAASGVRIEAPIPGKDAVGIEIPNKTVSTVYIRNLIENPQFRNLKSRISVCLGMDVAGSPVYMDIAKMPHLLIAGATGMGKSVCINSFIVSILYKARPDEVKFILIDPKKVEFNLYKGIPHLLIPVVSDPKKAAGALSWAVSEMERRFALIEEVGVRDIGGYNEITKNDPEKPRMCQIVIIIDELADLMMTARDEVESSICRLAQKARAAGMHIVIGTQRPSVDVITGLIKANIPSRIACTVASQVDSRTIIDISGAEKLIGKGDMLFAPVGCLKPMRVQGSFVSDGEVEAITDFLRSNFKAEYDNSIIEDIEREAARCGEKKKGKAALDDDEDSGSSSGNLIDSDEMIMPAIQVAVSAGQLSTSLLQRKLSLGYARAARILDILEQMGIVSGFNGSKPRSVLITEDQYLEMKMRQDSSEE